MSNLNQWGENYTTPTKNEVREILKELEMTGLKCGEFVGVNSRTVRRWTGGDCKIPYSAWRMLILKAGKIDSLI